jgi:hypothetical protein
MFTRERKHDGLILGGKIAQKKERLGKRAMMGEFREHCEVLRNNEHFMKNRKGCKQGEIDQ